MTIHTVNEPVHLQRLWQRCRASGLRMTIHRCDIVATGRDDRFIVAIYHPDRVASIAEVRTTNLESAATLILDKHGNQLSDA